MSKSQHSRKYDQLLKALRQTRKQAGLTQMEVAKKLGVYDSYISKCESGERRIDVIELADFCKLYGVPLKEFLGCIGLE